jgi:hypothetical protein
MPKANGFFHDLKEMGLLFKEQAQTLLAFTPRRCGLRVYKALRRGCYGEHAPFSPHLAQFAAAAIEAGLALPLPMILLKYHVLPTKLPYVPDVPVVFAAMVVFPVMVVSNMLLNTMIPQLSFNDEKFNAAQERPERVPAKRKDKGLDR